MNCDAGLIKGSLWMPVAHENEIKPPCSQAEYLQIRVSESNKLGKGTVCTLSVQKRVLE